MENPQETSVSKFSKVNFDGINNEWGVNDALSQTFKCLFDFVGLWGHSARPRLRQKTFY